MKHSPVTCFARFCGLLVSTLLLSSLLLPMAAQGASYSYDKLHRLRSVSYANGQVVDYQYDAAGNLLQVSSDPLEPVYQLSGTLTDAEGNPLAGVTLTLGAQSQTTDSQGIFLFADLVPGEYTLSVSAPGYLSQTVSVALTQEQPSLQRAITLQARPPIRPVLYAGVQDCANNSQTVSANRIRVHTPDGELIRVFDSGFSGKGIFLGAVDFDQDGALDATVVQMAKGNTLRIVDALGGLLSSLNFDGDKQGIRALFTGFGGSGGGDALIASQGKDTTVYHYHADGSPLHILTLLDKAAEFNLAAGDIDGDGSAEIILALARESNADNVRIYNANGQLLRSFAALGDKNRNPGLIVQSVDLDFDGRDEILVAPAEQNQGYDIAVYQGNGTLLKRFASFVEVNGTPPELAGCSDYAGNGLILTAGDSDFDGNAEIYAALNGGREVRVFSSEGALLNSFNAATENAALSALSLGSEQQN